MVDRQHHIQRQGAEYRQRHLIQRHNHDRAQHDQHIDGHLHLAGTQTETLLQVQRKDIHPAEASAVTEQHQQPQAHGETAEQRGIHHIQVGEADPLRG